MQQEVRWGAETGLLRSWKVQPGRPVSEGEVLALVEPVAVKLVSPVSGTVLNCLVKNNTKITNGYAIRVYLTPHVTETCTPFRTSSRCSLHTLPDHLFFPASSQLLCTISTCNHPILTITDVCTSCHVHLHDTSAYAFYITPSNHPIKRRVSDVEAESEAKKRSLLDSSRLVLVLDLDQTVLHAAQLLSYEGDLASKMNPEQEKVFAFELSGHSRMIVKFRPGLKEFLLQAHKLFEIHVYTMANAEYASKIVDLINKEILTDIDPILRNQVIGSRIITRSHTEDAIELQLRRQGGFAYSLKLQEKRKDIKHIVGDSSIAVILDDSESVWPDYLDHLIHVHPFVYWPGQDDLNNTFHARHHASQSSSTTLQATSSSSSSTTELSTPLKSSEGVANNAESQQQPSTKKRPAESYANVDSIEAIDYNVKKRKESERSDMELDLEHKTLDKVSVSANGSEKSTIDNMHPNSDGMAVDGPSTSTQGDASASRMIVDQEAPNMAVDQISGPALLSPFGIRFLPSKNNDRILESMLRVLQHLHEQFFALPMDSKRRKVQLILPRLRQQVLKGRRVCLSGVIPHVPKQPTSSSSSGSNGNHQPQQHHHHHHHHHHLLPMNNVPEMDSTVSSSTPTTPQWNEHTRVAQREVNRVVSFGAQYIEDLSPGNPQCVTHMVSARGSTMKVRIAVHERGIYCVTKKWLDHSTRHWQAKNEAEYRIPDIPICAGKPPIIEGGVYDDANLQWVASQRQQGEGEAATAAASIWSDSDVEMDRTQEEVPSSPLSDSFFDLEALLEHEDELSSNDSYDSEMEFA